MKHKFWKYQGTGNDFVFFDGREDVSKIKEEQEVRAKICDRRFGVGADGLIILEEDGTTDFRMLYYNSDGHEGSMCGNGGRCSIAFANFIGFASKKTVFEAVDGEHHGQILEEAWVDLGMNDVLQIEERSRDTFILDTGSPHYVRILDEDQDVDIVKFGREVRYGTEFKAAGINVNTCKITKDGIVIETYERGVEDETFSCGTGVTACAIAYSKFTKKNGNLKIPIITKGGHLSVSFHSQNGSFTNIVLGGPAQQVFGGEIEL